jgi:hypothetical protein
MEQKISLLKCEKVEKEWESDILNEDECEKKEKSQHLFKIFLRQLKKN